MFLLHCVCAELRRSLDAQAVILGTVDVDGGNIVIDSDCMWAKVIRQVGEDMHVSEKVYVYESDMSKAMPDLYDECVKWAKECDSISAFPTLLKAVVAAGQKYGPAFVPRKSNNEPRKHMYHEIAIAHGYYKREQLPTSLVDAVRCVWPSFADDEYMGYKDN